MARVVWPRRNLIDQDVIVLSHKSLDGENASAPELVHHAAGNLLGALTNRSRGGTRRHVDSRADVVLVDCLDCRVGQQLLCSALVVLGADDQHRQLALERDELLGVAAEVAKLGDGTVQIGLARDLEVSSAVVRVLSGLEHPGISKLARDGLERGVHGIARALNGHGFRHGDSFAGQVCLLLVLVLDQTQRLP